MSKRVLIPTQLRKLTDNEPEVEVHADTIGAAISELQSRYPGIQDRVLDGTGEVRRSVAIYVNEDEIRFLNHQQTALKDGDEITILPSISGG